MLCRPSWCRRDWIECNERLAPGVVGELADGPEIDHLGRTDVRIRIYPCGPATHVPILRRQNCSAALVEFYLSEVPEGVSMTLLERVRSSSSTIKTWYVGALTMYTILLAPIQVNFLTNLVFVGAILLGIPLLVVAFHRRSPADSADRLLRPPSTLRSQLNDELAIAHEQGVQAWWEVSAHEARWFEEYFAFWWKAEGLTADRIALTERGRALVAADYNDVPAGEVVPMQPSRSKASLVATSPFYSDSDLAIYYRRIDYELCMWVDRNAKRFTRANPDVSLFGVEEWLPYPSMICTHNVIALRDGWVVFTLRNPRTDFFPEAWSVSFEEQVEVGTPDGATIVDRTIGGAVRRGVREEFGPIASNAITSITALAVGRTFATAEHRSVRSCDVLNVVRLDLSPDELWAALADTGDIPDIAESTGWMACRFSHRHDVQTLLKHYPRNEPKLNSSRLSEDHRIEAQVNICPMSLDRLSRDRGYQWHPTSRARLLLWSLWANRSGLLP